jgi:membrane-associated protease RseP (regulator of RpoE activity)
MIYFMILLALLVFILGHQIPVWIFKVKLKDIRTQFSRKQIIYESSGVLICFAMAFILVAINSQTRHEKYLLNKNAIYGVTCESVATELGFKNGDKIISVNNQEIIRFSDILVKIITEPENTAVKIHRGDKDTIISVTKEGKIKIMKSKSTLIFTPKFKPDTSIVNTQFGHLVYTESRVGFFQSVKSYTTVIKYIFRILLPQREGNVSGFYVVPKVKNIGDFVYLFPAFLFVIGIINLLPIPGLDLGNTIIVFIEKIHKKKYNSRNINLIRIISVAFIVIIITIEIYLKKGFQT